MKKLFINETDYRGAGTVCCGGKLSWYSYDADMGDIRKAVEFLIAIGFVNQENVEIFDDERPLLAEYEKKFLNE